MGWVMIDDMSHEAASLARTLSSDQLEVEVMKGGAALEAMASGKFQPTGVLMDIELQNEKGFTQDGLALAQLMNTEQTRGNLRSFPIVRFSRQAKVAEFVGSDSTSDDSFDWTLSKEKLQVEGKLDPIRTTLVGLEQLYAGIDDNATLGQVLGVSGDYFEVHGHPSFSNTFDAVDLGHLKARQVARLLLNPGILINEHILAIRLGIDPATSKNWEAIKKDLAYCRFDGTAGEVFFRVWARALEQWWEETFSADDPLNSLTVNERIKLLDEKYGGVQALDCSAQSPGDRPWRFCSLTLQDEGEYLPVDPAYGVPLTPRKPNEGWEDPLYVSLGKASQNLENSRLDRKVFDRLLKSAQSSD